MELDAGVSLLFKESAWFWIVIQCMVIYIINKNKQDVFMWQCSVFVKKLQMGLAAGSPF